MNEDDEVVAWIGGANSPIRRGGELTELEVADATVAYLNNGNDLLSDARFLFSRDRFARGTSLAVLALEELGKVKIIVDTFLRFTHGVEPDAWKKYWKTGGSHRTKQEEILSYGKMIRKSFDGDPMHDRYLYRHYAPEAAFEKLDWLKQANFYVDIREDGIHAPKSTEDARKATDYLLAFAQERADSYGSWHVTSRRATDYLAVAVGGHDFNNWTKSYHPQEVYSDILYQASALSASNVPNYQVFGDYIQTYLKKNVAEKRVKEAILKVAAEMNLRMIEGDHLPIFRRRYFGAFKLLLGISESSNMFSASFRKELRSRLRSGVIDQH